VAVLACVYVCVCALSTSSLACAQKAGRHKILHACPSVSLQGSITVLHASRTLAFTHTSVHAQCARLNRLLMQFRHLPYYSPYQCACQRRPSVPHATKRHQAAASTALYVCTLVRSGAMLTLCTNVHTGGRAPSHAYGRPSYASSPRRHASLPWGSTWYAAGGFSSVYETRLAAHVICV